MSLLVPRLGAAMKMEKPFFVYKRNKWCLLLRPFKKFSSLAIGKNLNYITYQSLTWSYFHEFIHLSTTLGIFQIYADQAEHKLLETGQGD